jgi:hypothetical protein
VQALIGVRPPVLAASSERLTNSRLSHRTIRSHARGTPRAEDMLNSLVVIVFVFRESFEGERRTIT